MKITEIEKIIEKQHKFFISQNTKSISGRKQVLRALRKEIKTHELEINEALNNDFKKSAFETYLTETSIVLAELDLTISSLQTWSKPERVRASMLNFPSSDLIYREPYGSVLIIAPWNYPFQLALAPLIAAIAAGNTVILKPSELTPHTSALICKIVAKVFTEDYVKVVEGGVEISQNLLNIRWDYIFFTGSVNVGRIVAQAAAKNLTPVTLELGGKNPCIIDETAKLKLATKRIVWGKFLNAGQTCIAPDYILIQKEIKERFIDCLKIEIEKAYTKNPEESPDYPRIISDKNFDRLTRMLQDETIVIGGASNKEDLYISPTVIDSPSLESEVMKDEIFGPILPIIPYSIDDDIFRVVNRYDKPLSLYVFSSKKKFMKKIIESFSFGGGVVNDTLVHFANHRLPFGGVGNSGIGAYHGKMGFDTFSHKKSMTTRANWLDIPFRYAPYKGKMNLMKKVMKYLG